MVVGVLELTLAVPAFTLKEKRSVIRRVVSRTRQKFNVGVAEVDDLDRVESAVVGVVAVGNDRRYINGLLDIVANHVDRMAIVDIVDQSIEMENY